VQVLLLMICSRKTFFLKKGKKNFSRCFYLSCSQQQHNFKCKRMKNNKFLPRRQKIFTKNCSHLLNSSLYHALHFNAKVFFLLLSWIPLQARPAPKGWATSVGPLTMDPELRKEDYWTSSTAVGLLVSVIALDV
jgi:hypothetical protein